jgi:hypothetical protein
MVIGGLKIDNTLICGEIASPRTTATPKQSKVAAESNWKIEPLSLKRANLTTHFNKALSSEHFVKEELFATKELQLSPFETHVLDNFS